jgi:hypothetical protein
MGVSTRVLFLLATEGKIVRGRPLGAWTSGQYRWAPTETWLGEPLASIDHAEACELLLRRWLRTFGPATTTDIRWWTGWTAKLTKQTLEGVEAEEVALDKGTGWLLRDDVRRPAKVQPWVALLPSLDPTVMGWKERDWYLGEYGSMLFDRNGNAGCTVWASGRVVGGWTQGADGEVVVELLERVDGRTGKMIESQCKRMEGWLGDVRIKPRFGTPLQRSLQ